MEFIIGILIILTLISLFANLLLYLRQNRLTDLEKRYHTLQKELEDAISSFLIELKEENERFLTKYEQIQKEKNQQEEKGEKNEQQKLMKNLHFVNHEIHDLRYTPNTVPYQFVKEAYRDSQQREANKDFPQAKTNEENYGQKDHPSETTALHEQEIRNNEMIDEKEDHKLHQLLNKIRQLQKEGLTIEEIAQKLNRGKTEIELLVKFYLE